MLVHKIIAIHIQFFHYSEVSDSALAVEVYICMILTFPLVDLEIMCMWSLIHSSFNIKQQQL
jgi:hypothetical protein